MKQILTALLLTVVVFGWCGCASTGTNFDESKVSHIKKGETTEAQLVEMFGKPASRSMDSDGHTTLNWMYAESKVSGKSFIPYAGAFVGGSKSGNKFLVVNLGPNGTVDRYNVSAGGMDSRNTTQSVPK